MKHVCDLSLFCGVWGLVKTKGVLSFYFHHGCANSNSVTDTRIIDASDPSDQNKIVDLAVGLLSEGEVVALPTETVYGLGADALNSEAVAKIFAAKERPEFDPLIVHVGSYEQVDEVADKIGRASCRERV